MKRSIAESQLEADAEGTRPPVVIRELATHDELVEVEHVQRDVWALPDLEIVGNAHLRAVLHAGGQLAGAFVGERLVGFSYGFLAAPHGRGMHGYGLHSHMVAVREEARGRGVGQALKWDQRAWCLARGLRWITWTFDPLQSRNANLNLRHLGAIGAEYLVDFYGPMSGPLGGGQPTDRLLALWRLDSPTVTGLADGASADAAAYAEATWALKASGGGRLAEPVPQPPSAALVEVGRPLRVAVPADATYLLASAPELARRWREAVAAAMTPLFAAGYVAVQHADDAYVLAPFTENEKASLTI